MAGQTKVNPVEDFTTINYVGMKPLTFFEIDFGAAANAEVGPNEAIQKCIEICNKYATVVIRGDLHGTNQKMMIAVEQSNASLDYDQAGAETLVEQIEDEIIDKLMQALLGEIGIN